MGFIVQSDPFPETGLTIWKNTVETQARENSNQVRNDFKPFATGEGANVLEQLEYEKSGFLKEGFKKGMARSSEINKAIRQGSSIAAAVARFTAEKTGENLLDNGDIDTLSRHIETAIATVSSLRIAEAKGEADQLSASFVPSIAEPENGQLIHIRAKEANRTKTPTLNIDQLGAREIVKGNNLSLEQGDIAGAGHWLEMQYDEALEKWVLQNPAKGIVPSSGVPIGTIEYFAAATPPAGYLKADGSEVGREICADLYRVIGTTYGQGDGESTFNLPDLRGEFVRGWDAGRHLDSGRGFGTTQGDAIQNITGYFGAHSTLTANGVFSKKNSGASENVGVGGGVSSNSVFFDASAVVPTANENRPRNIALLACIKAFDAVTNPGLIDITELANEIGNLSNKFNDKWGGPSSRYIDLTLGASGSVYTAPDDGWFSIFGIVTTANYSVRMENTLSGFTSALSRGNASGAGAATNIPCCKGDSIYVYYEGFASSRFKFIFSKGDQ